MTKQRYFYFSLGPVQEFVGKARRLRDYWTGSYLLSYLTKQAIDEVCKNGGQIVFPPYEKNSNLIGNHEEHKIGSFPNRFQAEVPIDFEPNCCETRVRNSWREVADYIWGKYISEVAPLGKNTKEIWNRQIEGFWYIQWVIADEENDALLDIRKNWRSYIPTVEAGDKCTLFGNLQEISGYVRSSKKSEEKNQKAFWEKMRTKLALLDLKEGERLSSVALVKRLFPRVYNELKGTKLPENFPSTTYMSAIYWVETVMKNEKVLAADFSKEAKKLSGVGREAGAGIDCLEKIAGENKDLRDFMSLDGNLFYSHTLLNDNLWDGKDKPIRDNLEQKLVNINEKIGFKPDTYYALLSMDGDRMGAILQRNKDKKTQISETISTFSRNVPNIIKEHDGRVIYAGGEDVFAILPVDKAIDAAIKLKEKYTELFKKVFNSKEIATISAAIIFAHHHAPLNKLYTELQSLLNNIAKDKCGRASLAVSTWNTGGSDLVWAMPWDKFVDNAGNNLMSELAKTFGRANEAESISNSFIYNIRRNLGLFTLGDSGSSLDKEEILELLTAEYIRSRTRSSKNLQLTKEKVKPLMKNLLEICTQYYREDDGIIKEHQGFNIDGALLVKFLARRWHR